MAKKKEKLYVEIPKNGHTKYPFAVLRGYVKEKRLIILEPWDYPFENTGYIYVDSFGENLSKYQEVTKKAGAPRYLNSIKDLEKILRKHSKKH